MTAVTKVIVREFGGPEKLLLEEDQLHTPGPGEVRLRHEAIGLNYIDTYFRTGLYSPAGGLPYSPGLEAAGIIEAVGEGVTEFSAGQRVAYGTGPLGAYSTARNIDAAKLIALPDEVCFATAACIMLKGMTAQYLLRQTYCLQRGDWILVHAAAGGVGLLLCQWARHLGANVIGTVGSQEKAETAQKAGCEHVILYKEEPVAERVRDITGGSGVDVVYDGVGKDTFEASLDCLKPRKLMVSFGNASGAVTGVNLGILSAKGSLYVTRPTLAAYTGTRQELVACAAEVFEQVQKGILSITIGQRFKLNDVQNAHRALEGRGTVGATVIEPS